MINATVVKKYVSIGAVAILFILMYKISDDIGKQIAVSIIYFLKFNDFFHIQGVNSIDRNFEWPCT